MSVDEDKNIGATDRDRETEQRVLLPCPFCGGPAEKRITDGPKRGFIGCFTCMIGQPFNVPYGDAEIAAWNARAPVAETPPMCPVHAALDGKDELLLEISNNCVACSLNERTELLKALEPFVPEGEVVGSVEFLKRILLSQKKGADESAQRPRSDDQQHGQAS